MDPAPVPILRSPKPGQFTPKAMLSAPRHSAAVPNAGGTHALCTVSTYSFATHTPSSQIRVLDIKKARGDGALPGLQWDDSTTVLVDDVKASEPVWMGDGLFVAWLLKREGGKVDLMVGDAARVEESPYVAASFPAPVSNLKLKVLGLGRLAIAVTCLATPDGAMYNPANEPKSLSSGKVYTSLFVRHWDKYVTPNRNAIFYATLVKSLADASWSLKPPGFVNCLKGSGLESPLPPFGGNNHFDIAATGIIFVAKDPERNPATTTAANLYYVPLSTFCETEPPAPLKIKVDGLEGACDSPVFSHDGKRAAFLQMKNPAYESDRNRLVHVYIQEAPTTREFHITHRKKHWEVSPRAIRWSLRDDELLLLATQLGKGCLYSVSALPHAVLYESPTLQRAVGFVTDVFPLDDTNMLISSTSLVNSYSYSILNHPGDKAITILSGARDFSTKYGLCDDQVSDFWFPREERYEVHALVIKPPQFDETQTYPLAYFIHGGPQGSWNDAWNTRWNLALFAAQGYVVVAPNFTGSTGYGQDFTDRIQNQWGGRPYDDLAEGFEYIKKTMPYVDTERAVALGASYGGYMINWMQGQPLGRKFKALVSHDSSFNTTNKYTTDELYFPQHEFQGTLWDNYDNYERWNPARHVAKWSTPMLVIHSELDYRLPVSEGLAVFNVLQARGIESKLLVFPDENHWVLKPENSLQWHREVISWINHYVGLPALVEEEATQAERTTL
ncbi:MAG: hypothetical protein M1829_006301 [Trizodia sp. TS-e1964]|nr:MAG: hypothetical protein M1829_006301 [Trizodia sp. TS-e1964]